MTPERFGEQLLTWWDEHGRKDLPWQLNKSPYRVWVSEIMLQQTQVKTVIPFYQRFMARFPTVQALAEAPEDEVMHHWTGLGYYARARNLHKAAKIVSADYRGEFPNTVEALQTLPGIGRSTAGAIAAFTMGQSSAIMDGNVKRVLCRFLGIREWPGASHMQARLWELAERYTPKQRTGDYNQAMMDLGATLCTRSKPSCLLCPFNDSCIARLEDLTKSIPASKPKTDKPVKSTVMLMLQQQDGRVYLEKRPANGIWGGLYSFKEFEDLDAAQTWLDLKGYRYQLEPWTCFRHTFSHYHLDIQPVLVRLENEATEVSETESVWLQVILDDIEIGLAAPVKKLLAQIEKTQ
ncbi:A/G-specific adenine glycosylase [Gynuella sp.]|uniref:A/G-specific adenine glycosylase n=1 Tax=Gynuella sp. TaxID=2969146 RepID=UPI003D0DF779